MLVVCVLFDSPVFAAESVGSEHAVPEKIRLQLKWFHQFQFAGYYAAIDQGYYAEEGLDVEIKERVLQQNFVKQVVSGAAEYGVGDSGLVSQYAKGEPVVALAAIFQHNPLVFITRQDSGIVSPYEMAGKRIMSDIISTNEAPLRAMLADARITEKDYTLIQQNGNYDLLTEGKIDVVSGYSTDQPFYYRQKGVKVNVINPLNYGIDFYGDILFTSRQELHAHPGRAQRFMRASLKGWQYALDHPEEMIQLIHNKYHSKLSIEHLRFEAAETRKLIMPEAIALGKIDAARLKKVAEAYALSGFNRALSDEELSAFIQPGKVALLNLSAVEAAWLGRHPVIKVGIDPGFAPYEWVDEHGHYVGMAADYLRAIEKKLGVRFEIIKNRPWAEVLEMAKRGEIDMLACAVKTPDRLQYLTFTEPYKSTFAVIIDKGQGAYIGSLEGLRGKRVAVERGYFMQEMLEKHHPKIHLVLAKDTNAALQLVLDDKADAYVGDAGSANYAIRKGGLLSLRVSGQTEYRSEHSVAAIKRHPELVSIIDKAVLSIPKDESDAIFNRWLGLKIEEGVSRETLVRYGVAVLGLFVLFGFWLYRLRREIHQREAAQARVERLLVEQKAMLETDLVGFAKVSNRIIQWVNPVFEKMMGYAPGELIGKSTRIVYPDEAAYERLGASAYPLIQAAEVFRTQIQHVRKDGRLVWMDLSGVMLDRKTGETLWAFVDITEHKIAENELRIAAIAFESQEGMMVTDTNNVILRVNRAFTEITGYSAEEVIGQMPELLNSGRHDEAFYSEMWASIIKTGGWEGEIWNRRKNGEIYPEHLTITAVKAEDGSVTNYVAAMSDITLAKAAADEIRNLAFYDPLTRLPNRRLLMDRMQQALASSARTGRMGALLFIDLDNFKTLNDTLGHDVGDLLLQEVAERLAASVREGDTTARLGGDEFVVMLEDLSEDSKEATAQAEVVGHKVLAALNRPYQLHAHEHHSTPSIGATLFLGHALSGEGLLKQADIAMYQAKSAGKNAMCFFDPDIQLNVDTRAVT